ncbi:hypothetical protein R3I93_014748 [Phoxinus phoxinus]|uniref:Uncharacterized protein n=1 Tax=Phoxinus phoxinus TaxID=58324 RepID=A0AAN9H0C8_9TELE
MLQMSKTFSLLLLNTFKAEYSRADTREALLHMSLHTTATKRVTVYESIFRGRMQSNLHKHPSSCVTRINGKPIFGIPPSASRSTPLLSPESHSQQSFNSRRSEGRTVGLHMDRLLKQEHGEKISFCKFVLNPNYELCYYELIALFSPLPRKVNLQYK